jgi:predicted nucleic acid-binding protein
MMYVDSSVVIAEILVERRRPGGDFWAGPLVTSRLLEYEVWTRINALGRKESHAEGASFLLRGFNMLDLHPSILARALLPFPEQVRTLDAMHLASADFLRGRGQDISIATYDTRFREVARQMEFELYPLE